MRSWMRRIRGAIGMGLVWGAAWSAAGTVPRWVFGFNADAPFPLIFGVLGFVAGVTFAALLLLTERRRSFEQMSLPRFAAWGAVGGVLLAAIFTRAASLGAGDALAIAPTFAIASAVCAAGSLAIARRATRRELPGFGVGAGESTLTERPAPRAEFPPEPVRPEPLPAADPPPPRSRPGRSPRARE